MDNNDLPGMIIGLAIEIHKQLGPGLLESVYQRCLEYELKRNNFQFIAEKQIPVIYKGISLDCGFRADIVIENSIILELKAIEKLLPVHEAQLITYLKLTGLKLGYIINFNVIRLRDGIKRMVL